MAALVPCRGFPRALERPASRSVVCARVLLLVVLCVAVLLAVAGCDTAPTTSATPEPSPTVPLARLTLYVAAPDGSLTAYAAATGIVRWRFIASNPINVTPTEANGLVYIGANDGSVYAVHAANGTLAWRASVGTATGDMVVATPGILGDVVMFSTVSGRLVAFDASTGARRWESTPVKASNGNACIVSGPQPTSDVVYFGTSCGGVFALRPSDGHILWQRSVGPAFVAPTLAGGTLYVGVSMGTTAPGGGMTALRAADGKVLWTYTDSSAGLSRPVVRGDTVYASDDNASVFALDTASGKLRWANVRRGYGEVSSVVADARGVYLVLSGYLLALDPANGHLRWSRTLPGEEHGGPLAADGLIFTSAGDRYNQTLAAYATADGSPKWHATVSSVPVLSLMLGT